jgi:predicted transcriptional regulator
MKNKKTANDWLKELVDEIGGKEDEIPEGWMTAKDMTKELEMTIGQVETMMRRALRAGKVIKKQYRIDTKGAGVKLIWHYHKA